MDLPITTGFWVASIGLCVLAAVLLIGALVRRHPDAAPPAASDLAVYRDQLREVERDLARGVIGAEDAERLRTEVSRRVLEADRAVRATATARAAPAALTYGVAALVVVLLAGSVWTYWQIGAPGYPDLPLERRIADAEAARASRPLQAIAEAGFSVPPPPEAADPAYLALVDKLRTAVAARPDDLAGHRLLAQHEAALGNAPGAYRAQARVVGLLGAEATAQDHAVLADQMIVAAGGYVSPEAETALTEALRRDAANGTALYYSGLMFAQTGRPDLAFRIWQPLYEDSPPGAPWMPPLRAQLGEVAGLAGVNYELPAETGPAGPDAGQIEAAGEMSPEDREAMIRGMVAGLSDRLATSGGSAAEWAQLITALGVLGDRDQAGRIWAEAQTVFADAPADLATVQQAAEQAGLTR